MASRLARRELATFCSDVSLDESERESVRLLVSELVANAVRHGRANGKDKIRVRVRASGEVIRIEVADRGPGFEQPRVPPKPRGAGGYGLFLVDRLCSRWGVQHEGGSLVWCELPRDAQRLA